MMQSNTVDVYKDAASCLRLVAEEIKKEHESDLNLMLDSCKRCQPLLDQLKVIDNNVERQTGLDQLSGMVKHFIECLEQRHEEPEVESRHSRSLSSDCTESINERRIAIEDTIVEKGNLTFDDIAGLTEAKQALKEAIVVPIQYPQLFTGGCKPWRRILLYGPPGTGKSRLAQAISAEIESTFYSVSSSDLVSSWLGESEKLIKELFTHARNQTRRSVIFIDEIDSICRKRSSREEEHTRRIKNELLKQMEGADNSHQQDQIFLLCATNCPWELDLAFLRRFQKRIYVQLPDKESRVSLIKIHCKDNPVNLTDQDWQLLAERTEGYSGSDIANVVLEAMFQPIRMMQSAQYWKHIEGNKLVPCDRDEPGAFMANITEVPGDQVMPREVTLQDFLSSLASQRCTIKDEELMKFENFRKQYGHN